MDATLDRSFLSLGQVATRFDCRTWQVRRIYERGLLPEPDRLGIYRIIWADKLDQVEAALRAAGYIGEEACAAAK